MLFVVAPFIVGALAGLLLKSSQKDVEHLSGGGPMRALLLTAHPDDEAMFFAPTVLALTKPPPVAQTPPANEFEEVIIGERPPELFSLCLSTGNADGLGKTRKQELFASLEVLGVPSDRSYVLDHEYVKFHLRRVAIYSLVTAGNSRTTLPRNGTQRASLRSSKATFSSTISPLCVRPHCQRTH